jgi:hypothetical protein
MASVTIDSKQLIKDYLDAINANPKTEVLINQYVRDPSLNVLRAPRLQQAPAKIRRQKTR